MTTAIFCMLAATTAKSLQSCPTLCDPTDGSPPGLPGIFQARVLKWGTIAFSVCMLTVYQPLLDVSTNT